MHNPLTPEQILNELELQEILTSSWLHPRDVIELFLSVSKYDHNKLMAQHIRIQIYMNIKCLQFLIYT